jgi:hypothetical protein
MAIIWPDFFLVGAAKAGTTSLFEYLKRHEQVFMPAVKEPHFFSNVQRTAKSAAFGRWYGDEQDYLSLYAAAGGYRAIGDASTSYL